MADELSADELLNRIVELEDELEEAKNTIAELSADQVKGGKGKKGANKNEIAQLEADIEELHDKFEASQATVSNLREELAASNIKVQQLTADKLEVDRKAKTQADRIKELEKEISKVTAESAQFKQQSKNVVEQNSLNFKQSQRAFEENQNLKTEIEGLRQQIQQMEEEKDSLEQALAHLDDELQQTNNERDSFDLERQELQTNIITVSRELETVKSELDETFNRENELRVKHDDLKVQVKQLTQQLNAANANSAKEITSLQDTIKMLKDTTKLGEKQRKIDQLEKVQSDLLKEIEGLKGKLDEAALERDHLAENLLEIDDNLDTRVAEKISIEKHKCKQLEVEIESLKQQNQETVEYYQQVERDKNDLSNEVDELLAWKSIYEAGHGLQELAKAQKKLKDDNRRLTVAVEQLSTGMDMIRNTNNVLNLAFDKLKSECGKKPNFQYPEYELQIEAQSINNKLKAQVLELESQVFELEKENTKVRVALKNQAGSISEQGFKYAGMTAEMLMKVNDFASNLRDGKIDLPLDDQSRVLQKENLKLKEKLSALELEIQQYQRMAGGSIGPAGFGGDDVLTNHDVNKILQDNRELHGKMNSLQAELVNLIKHSRSPRSPRGGAETGGLDIHSGQALPSGMISQDELVTILSKNNDLILNELQQLRDATSSAAAAGGVAMIPDQALPPQYYAQPPSRFSHYQPQPVTYQSDAHARPPMSKPVMSRQFSSGSGGVAGAAATPAPQGAVAASTPARISVVTTPAAHHIQTPSAGAGVPHLWTASMGRGGMPFAPGTPAHSVYNTMGGPATPHGKQMLAQSISQMNLPPEEWAVDMKDLNAQLIECLEQLYDREQELEESARVVGTLEETLVAMKQQLATLYYDYSQRNDAWEAREKQLKQDCTALHNERDDLKLKLDRASSVNKVVQQENPESLQARLIETTRKLTIYEVNETILSRKYIAQSEQLTSTEKAKQQLEMDFIEMEDGLKKRILYLEQYKLTVSSQMTHLQAKLDASVSVEDYLQLQLELENLRDDHLNTLRREVEARMACLRATDSARELRSARIMMAHQNVQIESSNSAVMSLEAELIHQKEATERAVKAINSTSDVAMIVSEMARFRGEASRLEVELMAANRRSELLAERVSSISQEADAYQLRVKELEGREIDNSSKEAEARKKLLETQLRYEGGLTKTAAEELKAKHEKCVKDLEEAHRDVIRYRELAEIASQQASSLHLFKKQYTEEIAELREYCTRLESHSEDELLIGRLQRELMSTKTSYRAFVRKYNYARESMRKRELAMRILEGRLDEQEKSVSVIQDAARLEINALKKALRNMKNTVVEDNSHVVSKAIKGGTLALIKVDGVEKPKPSKKSNLASILTVSIGEKLLNMSNKVDELSIMAEDAVARAAAAEKECLELRGDKEDLQAEKAILEQRSQDLLAATKNKPNEKKIAERLYVLSEEIRVNKLSNFQQRRKIQTLQQEKRHLQSVISNIEADVNELEEDKVKVETTNMLMDIQQDTEDAALEKESHLLGSTGLFGGDLGMDPDLEDANGATTGKKAHFTLSKQSKKATEKVQGVVGKLKLDINDLDEAHDELTPEELLAKLKQTNEALQATQRDISEERLTISKMQGRMEELQNILKEKDDNIAYYEKVLRDTNQGDIALNPQRKGRGHHTPSHPTNMMLQQEQQEKLQIAASATINSLSAIIQEKNQTIEKLREKLESQVEAIHHRSRAEKKADELLEKYKMEDEVNRSHNMNAGRSMTKETTEDGPYAKMLEQLERGDRIIQDKDELIRELELKLNATQNKCERAEIRCGETLQEIENMKADMITLVDQLGEAEAKAKMYAGTRGGHSSPVKHHTPIPKNTVIEATTAGGDAMMLMIDPIAMSNKIKEYQKTIKANKTKIAAYHEVIIKLKDEFVQSQSEYAAKLLQATKAAEDHSRTRGGRGGSDDGPRGGAASQEELREFQYKFSDMKKELLQTKDELIRFKKLNEKMKTEYKEDNDERDKQLQKMEDQCTSLHESNTRLKRELEETKRKEVRLRAKLSDVLSGDAGGAGSGSGKGAAGITSLAKAREQIEHLERELDIVKTQNIAFRKESYLQSQGGSEDRREESPSRGPGGGGRVLGSAGGAGMPMDDARAAAAAKWENEKKMQKRVGTLEKRLQEKIEENDELKKEVGRLTTLAQSAIATKEEYAKRANSTTKKVDESRKLTSDDLTELETAQMNIFMLEQELAKVTRIAEVDRVNEINQLQQRITGYRNQINELEADKEDLERRVKTLSSGGPREDEYFAREDRLRDLLDLAKRQKMDLEAALLDKDSQALRQQFEIEQSEQEIQRLHRRLKESQANYKAAVSLNSAAGIGAPPGTASGTRRLGEVETAHGTVITSTGVKSRKDKEQDATIDAMRAAMEKLRTENERLKRAAPLEDHKVHDAQKQLALEKKKVEKLEEEVAALTIKSKNNEDSSQKIVQRQMQITTLRKQLKQKEDEMAALREAAETVSGEKDSLRRKTVVLEEKIQQLEMALQQAASARQPPAATTRAEAQAQQQREDDLKNRVADLQSLNERLKGELQEARKVLQSSHFNQTTGGSSGVAAAAAQQPASTGAGGTVSVVEFNKLKNENAKLRQELSAFDLDFFEEIENLKYAHSEAMRRLKMYESADQQRRSGGEYRRGY